MRSVLFQNELKDTGDDGLVAKSCPTRQPHGL